MAHRVSTSAPARLKTDRWHCDYFRPDVNNRQIFGIRVTDSSDNQSWAGEVIVDPGEYFGATYDLNGNVVPDTVATASAGVGVALFNAWKNAVGTNFGVHETAILAELAARGVIPT